MIWKYKSNSLPTVPGVLALEHLDSVPILAPGPVWHQGGPHIVDGVATSWHSSTAGQGKEASTGTLTQVWVLVPETLCLWFPSFPSYFHLRILFNVHPSVVKQEITRWKIGVREGQKESEGFVRVLGGLKSLLPKVMSFLEPRNTTLFGNRVIVNVIS